MRSSFAFLAGLGALLSLFTACNSEGRTTPLTAAELVPFQACTAASDCVYVENGCCDCANGGGAAAINRNQLEAFREQFDCSDTPCTEIARVPSCDSGAVGCTDSLCTYTLP